jgi:Tol biopolymer transport system component
VFDLTSRKVTRLTDSPDYEVCPAYSPDGKQVVYCAGVPGDRADHVFVHSLIDNSTRQLTTADANDGMPVFSPDGSQIAFARDKTHVWGGLAANWDGSGVICIVNSDGTNERELTGDDVLAYQPQFSPDGKFVSYSTINGRFSIPVDGSGPATPLPGPAEAYTSADGKHLAYTRGRYESDAMLYVSDSDGTNERQLTQGGYHAVFGRKNDRFYMLKSTWPDGLTGYPVFRIEEVLISDGTRRAVTDWEFLNAPLESDENVSR